MLLTFDQHIAALCVGLAPGMLPPRKKPQTAADGSPITCRQVVFLTLNCFLEQENLGHLVL